MYIQRTYKVALKMYVYILYESHKLQFPKGYPRMNILFSINESEFHEYKYIVIQEILIH